MAEAYIVDALRTPTGKRKGSLANVHPADMGAFVLKTLVGRNAVPADDIEDVVFGCLDAIGPQAGNIARSCWLAAGLPMHVPGVTIDRQGGSSQQAGHCVAQAVRSGTNDVITIANNNAKPIPQNISCRLGHIACVSMLHTRSLVRSLIPRFPRTA